MQCVGPPLISMFNIIVIKSSNERLPYCWGGHLVMAFLQKGGVLSPCMEDNEPTLILPFPHIFILTIFVSCRAEETHLAEIMKCATGSQSNSGK